MITISAPARASENLRHAIELLNHDLDVQKNLDTHQQNQLWTELRQYAQSQMEGRGRNAPLIVSERISDAVRDILADLDRRMADHLHRLEERDHYEFWQLLHGVAEQQEQDTKSPKARHGGGGS
jgi:hypothetical protein